MSSDDKPQVKTARTTFEILEEIKERKGVTVTELSESFTLSKSSIHNYLRTLERDGYVIKDGKRYRIGLKILDLGGHARRRQRICQVAEDEIFNLAEETGELANLLVEEQGMGIYLQRIQGANAVKTDSYIGQQVHLHNTALGNAILAHLPRERVEDILDQHGMPRTTEHTITNRQELFEKLAEVREEGVAFDDEERVKGLRCVAVPIVNNDDVVEGAISVSGPTSRFGEQRFKNNLPDKLKNVANVIGLNITYTEN